MGADVKYRQPLTRPVLGVRQLKQTGHDHLLKCWPTNEFHVDSLLRETNGVHPKNEARLLCGTKLTNSLQQITTQTRISAIMKPQSTIVTNVSCWTTVCSVQDTRSQSPSRTPTMLSPASPHSHFPLRFSCQNFVSTYWFSLGPQCFTHATLLVLIRINNKHKMWYSLLYDLSRSPLTNLVMWN